MSSIFKCSLEINNKKYRICINGNNGITLNDVNNKLQQIDGLEQISYNTHSFELFDEDFGEYLAISDENDIIENLARIRILRKPTNPTTVTLKINDSKSDECSHANTSDSKQGFHDFNNSFHIPSTSKANSKDLDNFYTPPNSQSSQNLDTYGTEIQGNMKSSDLKSSLRTEMTAYRIKTMKFMIKIINENKRYFINEHLNFKNWIKVSNQMKNAGFFGSDALKCKKDFYHFAALYRDVLEYSANYAVASSTYPLFKLYHGMDLSPFYVTTNPTFKNLCLLRERFEQKEKTSSIKNGNEIQSRPVKKESVNGGIQDMCENDMNDDDAEIQLAIDSYENIVKREQSYNGQKDCNESQIFIAIPSKKIKIEL